MSVPEQVFKRRARALGWLAALLSVCGSGNVLKPRRGGGGLAAIAEQRHVQVPPAGSPWPAAPPCMDAGLP